MGFPHYSVFLWCVFNHLRIHGVVGSDLPGLWPILEESRQEWQRWSFDPGTGY